MSKAVWIDTDPGVDDALALIWALQNEANLPWKIHGISTVRGNLALPQVNGNLKALINHLGRRDVPLYEGASLALIQTPLEAAFVHGQSFGPWEVSPCPTLSNLKAAEALAACLLQLDEPLTLITLGPLTNIALFLRLYPELAPKIEHIVLTGGGSYGNTTPFAEFNIYCDPEAASIVLKSGIPITMSTLDVSAEQAYILPEECEGYLTLARNSWTRPFLNFLCSRRPRAPIALYDPTAMLAAACPELFEVKETFVSVQLEGEARGMTLMVRKPSGSAVHILSHCSRSDFLHRLFTGL